MRIAILAAGTRGDVHPPIALGLGLQAAGHAVRLAAPLNYEALVTSRGLEYFPLHIDFRNILQIEAGQALLNANHNILRLIQKLKYLAASLVEHFLTDLWQASQKADVIFFSTLTFPAYYFAKDLGIPAVAVCMQPLSRTCAFPSPMIPSWLGVSPAMNRATYVVVEQMFWQFLRPFIQHWRKRFGLSSVSLRGPFSELYREHVPMFCGYSPLVVPKPNDWGQDIHVTGYWSLDHDRDWSPPSQLDDFLASGPPPVCVGFGSMNDGSVGKTVEVTLRTMVRLRKRAIVLTGWSDLSGADFPVSDEVFVIEEAPHSWLLPRVAALIHHGGAGTTAAALRASVPSIICPFFFDQAFWGQRVAALGVGSAPIPRHRLTPETLMTAVQVVTENQTLRRCVARLSQRLQAEDGIGQAVGALHRYLACHESVTYESFLTRGVEGRTRLM